MRASTATATNTNIRYTFENAKNLIARFGARVALQRERLDHEQRAEHERRDRVEAADVAGERRARASTTTVIIA